MSKNKLYYVRVDIYVEAKDEGSAEDKVIAILDKSKKIKSYDVCERGETHVDGV